MSAYLVFSRIRVLDDTSLARYSSDVPATMDNFDAQVLAAYGEQVMLEGAANQGTVILQFGDMAAAKRWYDSPAYQAARKHRVLGAEYTCVLVQGV